MIITISGDLGSGKSTVGKLVSKQLKLKYYSTGMMFRKVANDMRLSLQELTKLSETDKRIDKRIDDYQVKLGETEDNFLLEGRLGFHFIPNSIKIYLKVSPEEAARRIFTHNRLNEKYENQKDALKNIKIRRSSEIKRYKEFYNVDLEDESNYDLVINTNPIPAVEVATKIIRFIKDETTTSYL